MPRLAVYKNRKLLSERYTKGRGTANCPLQSQDKGETGEHAVNGNMLETPQTVRQHGNAAMLVLRQQLRRPLLPHPRAVYKWGTAGTGASWTSSTEPPQRRLITGTHAPRLITALGQRWRYPQTHAIHYPEARKARPRAPRLPHLSLYFLLHRHRHVLP